jgi:hypothetical protein
MELEIYDTAFHSFNEYGGHGISEKLGRLWFARGLGKSIDKMNRNTVYYT